MYTAVEALKLSKSGKFKYRVVGGHHYENSHFYFDPIGGFYHFVSEGKDQIAGYSDSFFIEKWFLPYEEAPEVRQMNTELLTYKERLTKWIENGDRSDSIEQEKEEPTVKVSELRELISWCEETQKDLYLTNLFELGCYHTWESVIMQLNRLCKEGE